MIRSEQEEDRPAVHAVNTAAFGREDEAELVDTLRRQAHPLISLVALEDNSVVGHIMFTPLSLTDYHPLLLGLAPMAVVPFRQRTGIGSALVRTGLDACRRLGAHAVFVLGHPEFYPRFGFSPAADFGITCEYDVPHDTFMAIELAPDALRAASGTVSYHAAFRDV